jgi:hypothetical protein
VVNTGRFPTSLAAVGVHSHLGRKTPAGLNAGTSDAPNTPEAFRGPGRPNPKDLRHRRWTTVWLAAS